MSAQERQQRAENEMMKNELNSGKDASRARDEVQNRDMAWAQRSQRGGVIERGYRAGGNE
ncbi:hypothetical protein J3459_018370 [Metarhizium acridum]|nr:hypothetical protein J3459_018370 [Metarhizium acridum]